MEMDIFSYAIMLFGFLFIVLGLIIWKKQKITLLHGYNNRKVKKEDVKGYTESIGKAHIIMGIAMLLLVITNNADNYGFIGTILWMIGLVISLVIIIKTQKKYNAGIFN